MALRDYSCAEVVFLTCAACVSESDNITLAGPVSPSRTLNAAYLRGKKLNP